MTSETILEPLEDGWIRKTFFNHKHSKFRVTYLYKGKHQASVIHFETRAARHLAGYQLVDKDLRDALIWLDYAKNIDPAHSPQKSFSLGDASQIIIKGLFKAAVVNYIKAFDVGKGRFIALHKSQLPKELQKSHTFFYDLRNEYIAHGGDSEFEECQVVFAIPPKNKIKTYAQFTPQFESTLRQAVRTDCNAQDFNMLIEASRKIISQKIDTLKSTLMKDFMKLDLGKLYQATKNGKILTITDKNFPNYLGPP